MKADVAVIGAGPAGSTAAEIAARAGACVVVVERKAEIGSPVQCGGFLPENFELRELLPRAMLPESLYKIPERCILHHTNIQRIYAPSGGSKEFRVQGRVLDRRTFDRYLAYRAAEAGAEIFPATRAEVVSEGVKLSGHFSGSLQPKVIIGADGPSSGAARFIGSSKKEFGICLEYEMAGVCADQDAAEMYFGSRCAPGGYAWIIPLGDGVANVGIGVRKSYLGRAKLDQILGGFIKDHPVASEKLKMGKVTAVIRGLVPAGGSPSVLQKNGVILAGDAAGHVMATSGGGIPLAMVAGRVAGEVASEVVLGKAQARDYEPRVKAEVGAELDRSVQIRRMVDAAMHNDRLMDALFSALEPPQMKSVMRGRIPDLLGVLREVVGRR